MSDEPAWRSALDRIGKPWIPAMGWDRFTLDVEAELAETLAEELRKEVDAEIVRTMHQDARNRQLGIIR